LANVILKGFPLLSKSIFRPVALSVTDFTPTPEAAAADEDEEEEDALAGNFPAAFFAA